MRRFFSPNAVSLFNMILVNLVCKLRVVCTSTRLLCLVGGGDEDRVIREDESGQPGVQPVGARHRGTHHQDEVSVIVILCTSEEEGIFCLT